MYEIIFIGIIGFIHYWLLDYFVEERQQHSHELKKNPVSIGGIYDNSFHRNNLRGKINWYGRRIFYCKFSIRVCIVLFILFAISIII